MTNDVLSDVLRAVRLTGAIYFDLELHSPWVAEAPASADIAGIVMPGAQRVLEYHVVARGGCWAHAIGQDPRRMQEGDLIAFPQGDPHVISSAPGLRGKPDLEQYRRSGSLPIVYEMGGGGPDRARVICGFLGFDDRPFNPLIASLPRMIHLPAAGAGHGWLRGLLDVVLAESESARAGRDDVLARLSELMFVEMVRRYLEGLPPGETGWLAGLRDDLVGRALGALHARPREDWTVESLARDVGASRSVLAERFTAMVGQPPMQYLTLWRMQLASRLLADGGQVAAVADAVGYASEAAFSRAFKKIVGQPPRDWRQRSAR
ncbi:MAG: AraC family transcriptional regulator [Vicinamibacterales bacterium]